MISKITLVGLIVFALSRCIHVKKSTNEIQGVIQCCDYYWNSKSPTKVEVTYNLLYRGKYAIQELPRIKFVGDSTVSIVDRFSFMDAVNNVCYLYKEFSHKAHPIQRLLSIDSVSLTGGYNVFYNKNSPQYNTSVNLNDTIINKEKYGRFKIILDSSSIVLYYRCDKKQIPINMYYSLTDSIGCPIIRMDASFSNGFFISRQWYYMSENLSEGEIKVFDHWINNTYDSTK